LADALSAYYGTEVGCFEDLLPGKVSTRVATRKGRSTTVSLSGAGAKSFVAEEMPVMRVVFDTADSRFKKTFSALTGQRAKAKAAALAKREQKVADIRDRIDALVVYLAANDRQPPPQRGNALGRFYHHLVNMGICSAYYDYIAEKDAELMKLVLDNNAHRAKYKAVTVTKEDVQEALVKTSLRKLMKVQAPKTDDEMRTNAIHAFLKNNKGLELTVNDKVVKCSYIKIPTNAQWHKSPEDYAEEQQFTLIDEEKGATTADRIAFHKKHKRPPMASFECEQSLLSVKWTL
jgi:hypothetical protein